MCCYQDSFALAQREGSHDVNGKDVLGDGQSDGPGGGVLDKVVLVFAIISTAVQQLQSVGGPRSRRHILRTWPRFLDA